MVRLERCPALYVLMRPDLVVPESKQVQLLLHPVGIEQQPSGFLLQGAEQPFNATILPGMTRLAALMPDTQPPKPETEQP